MVVVSRAERLAVIAGHDNQGVFPFAQFSQPRFQLSNRFVRVPANQSVERENEMK